MSTIHSQLLAVESLESLKHYRTFKRDFVFSIVVHLVSHLMFRHNFGKCEPINEILLP